MFYEVFWKLDLGFEDNILVRIIFILKVDYVLILFFFLR